MALAKPFRPLILIFACVIFWQGAISARDHGVTQATPDRGKVREVGLKKYDELLNNILTVGEANRNTFWQLANALNSALDFCVVAKLNCDAVGAIALEFFNKKITRKDPWWWDDYGWWGWLFLQLFETTKKTEYLDAAENCASQMLISKHAWSEETDPVKKAQQVPCFDNGCYNTYLVTSDKNDNFTGIQNTVTNALFLRLSLGLFEMYYRHFLSTKDLIFGDRAKGYWSSAMTQYQWFNQWFAEGLLNKLPDGQSLLVEERVAHYKDGSKAIGYEKNRNWVADQGLVMSAMALLVRDYKVLANDNPLGLRLDILDPITLLNIGSGIARGVKQYMVDKNSLLLIAKTDPIDEFPYGDQTDYIPGPGIYMRNLAFSAKNNELIKAMVNDNDYKRIITINAENACNDSIPDANVGYLNYSAGELDKISSYLSITEAGRVTVKLVKI